MTFQTCLRAVLTKHFGVLCVPYTPYVPKILECLTCLKFWSILYVPYVPKILAQLECPSCSTR